MLPDYELVLSWRLSTGSLLSMFVRARRVRGRGMESRSSFVVGVAGKVGSRRGGTGAHMRLEKQAVVTGAIVAMSALAASASVYRSFGAARRPASPVGEERSWQSYAVRGAAWGPSDAPVVAVEFSDFQCPFCRRYASYMDSLESMGYRVRRVYRHMLSPAHPHALGSAIAFECAAKQSRAPEMYRALHARPESLGTAAWWWFAREAGVKDSVMFADCVSDTAVRREISMDSVAGAKLKIRGTPVVLLNRVRLNGLPSFDSLKLQVDRAISSSR